VEGLAWYESRLFSAGLQGSVVEYDLFTQTPKVFILNLLNYLSFLRIWAKALEEKEVG
jgi:hypothetical protein